MPMSINLKTKLFALMAIMIIVSFLMHAVEFNHHHMDEFFGSTEQAINHASDKKKFLAYVDGLLLVMAAFTGMMLLKLHLADEKFRPLKFFKEEVKLFDPIFMGLKKGRIQAIYYH
jgi:hypothetical protein